MVNFLDIRKNYLILNWFIINSITTFFNKVLGMGLHNIRVGFIKYFILNIILTK